MPSRAAAQMRIKNLDPVRRLAYERMRQALLSHVDVSRAIGRNSTYIAQWLFRGTPKELSEEVRLKLATVLKLDPEHLRQAPLAVTSSEPTPVEDFADQQGSAEELATQAYEILRRFTGGSGDDVLLQILHTYRVRSGDEVLLRHLENVGRRWRLVPVYSDSGPVREGSSVELAHEPPGLSQGGLYALRISRNSYRLRVGDLAFVRPDQPARPTDTVVLVTKNELRVAAIGELITLKDKAARIRTSDGVSAFELATHRLDRVLFIALA